MSLYSTDTGCTGTLPCGFMSCLVAEGLLEGTDRDEKRALRQAEDAERAFRTSRGYVHENLVDRLTRPLRPPRLKARGSFFTHPQKSCHIFTLSPHLLSRRVGPLERSQLWQVLGAVQM